MTLLCMGDAAEGRSHLDRALALYDSAQHRPLAARFGHDVRAAILSFRPLALWLLGYPKTALMETTRALDVARETDHVPTLLFALSCTAVTLVCCRDYAAAAANTEECIALAQEKVPFMKMFAAGWRGCVLAQTGRASEAVEAISPAIAGMREIGVSTWSTAWLTHLAIAHAELGELDDAWRCIDEAMTRIKTTKERWHEPEVNRIAGEIALDIARSKCDKSRGVLRACTCGGTQAASQILGTPRRHEPHASGATRVRCSKRANCCLRFTAGSRRGSTRVI